MYFHKYLFLFLPSFVLDLDLSLNSTIYFNRLVLILCSLNYTSFTSRNTITKRSFCFIILKIIYVFFGSYFKSFHLIFSSHLLILSILYLIPLVLNFFGKPSSLDFRSCSFCSGFETSKTSICFLPCSAIIFIWFSNASPRGEYVNVACSILLL